MKRRARPSNTRLIHWRPALLALSIVRVVVGIVAIPLAPFLYREHFVILTLMRPTKDVLLFGGFLARQHKVHVLLIVIAAIPLAIAGVWQAFALGRAYATEIRAGKVPGIGGRVVKPKRIKPLQKALRKRGWKIVFLGRLAIFPSSAIGVAAGASGVPAKQFLLADAAGGLLSIVEVVAAGFALGAAYKSGKPWLTAVGGVFLIGAGVLIGRALRRD